MDLIWGMLELGLTIGADLLPRAEATCPHCGKVVSVSPPSPFKPKSPDDELAGHDISQAARDRLSAAIVGVAALAMLSHIGLYWYWNRPSPRHPRTNDMVTAPPEPAPPVASLAVIE